MKLSIPWRAKLKAFGAHIVISIVVFVGIIALTVWLWYPPPFFWIDGGLQITLLAAAIDIVAGPLLTFVVYRPNKPRLTMNLAVIAALQAGALAWGVGTLYSQRPVLMAFVPHNQNRFFPITEAQVAGGSRSLEELRGLSPYRPPMVFIDMPEDAAQASSVLASQTSSVLRQTERFHGIDHERLLRIIRASRTPKQYEVLAPDMAAAIERFVSSHGGNSEAFAFVPLWGRFGFAMLALSRADGKLIGVASREVRLR
ncbi:MAG TPA: hypothetical protein VJT77_08060 [Burkholderiales bacterium]|nr:hypothetical protein [Burkholderiales bacterium]